MPNPHGCVGAISHESRLFSTPHLRAGGKLCAALAPLEQMYEEIVQLISAPDRIACPHVESAMGTKPPLADETAGYVDLFSDTHRNKNPVILLDGTSIKWPKNWSQRDADRWRKLSGLERPKNTKPPTRR